MANSSPGKWLLWIPLVLGAVGFGFALHRADVAAASASLAAAGPILLLGLLPHVVQIGLDALAWRTLLAALGRRVAWHRLFAIRLSTEAVLMSMPSGSIVSETLKPYLLRLSDGVPLPETIASIAVKRCLIVFSHAAYLATASLVGGWLFVDLSQALTGGPALPWFAAGGVVLLLSVGIVLALGLSRGALGRRFHCLLLRLPGDRLRRWLEARRGGFSAADTHLGILGGARAHRAAALAALYGAWLVEAFETWLLMRLIGFDLPFSAALAMEAIVVFLRNLAFFVPAGLGVQDAGYLAILRALGLDVSVAGPAFVICKRAKELFWIAAGYLILTLLTHWKERGAPVRALLRWGQPGV